jgi:hypothetical protein
MRFLGGKCEKNFAASIPATPAGDFVLKTGGYLTIFTLQFARLKEFARGFRRVGEYITADRFDVLLDIRKLLCEEDSQRGSWRRYTYPRNLIEYCLKDVLLVHCRCD